jgi:hypothetical protein
MTALALLCNADKKSETGTNKKEKLFEKYTYVEQLPNVKLLKNGIKSTDVFKILGKQTGGSVCYGKYYPSTKNIELIAMGKWYLYSMKNNQPRLLKVWVYFTKTVNFAESARETFFDGKTTPAQRNLWAVEEFEYEYCSYQEEKKKDEDILAQKKKDQKILKNTIISPVSYKITSYKKFIKMKFNLKIQNNLENSIHLIYTYTTKGRKCCPGFTLPRGITLEYYSKSDNKGWLPLGKNLELLSKPETQISANSSDSISFSLKIFKQEIPLLGDPLRIRVRSYSINNGDFNGQFYTRPFKLKDLQQKTQTSIQQ